MSGHVYLIGAGCGKYDLITLRGINALRKCSCIVYDALTDPELLIYAPENAEFICVGKRSGKHSAAQEKINALLVEKAFAGHTVGRLKGGDPFVFGRGGEETAALREHDIGFTVIPGISSSIAVPELAGIPVTHRKVSRGFHVITAHTADGSRDFSQYAALDGTLVFLMGLNALPDIAEGLIRGGMSGDIPAAVISDGGTYRQRTIRASLRDIAAAAVSAEMTAPAVIAVGDTAGYDFSGSPETGALYGVSVTVTGTRKFTDKLANLLEAEGAQVRRYSHVRVERECDIPQLDGYGCIVFTSSYGAEMFIDDCRKKHTDMRSLSGKLIAAVGSGTAGTLEDAGIYPDIVPERYTVADLAHAVCERCTGKVLVLRAKLGSGELNRVFDERGVDYDDVRIYDTRADPGIPPMDCNTDHIVFGSSFGVRSFFDGGSAVSGRTRIVCIGSQTAETAKEYTVNAVITASPHSAEGVLDTIKGEHKK